MVQPAPPSLTIHQVSYSQVLQVANSNTVKDRFLFLFDGIPVVAKPATQDYDAL